MKAVPLSSPEGAWHWSKITSLCSNVCRIKEGLTFGDAFLKAKNDFARESIAMRGYMDKTEEKTLLEFVLYADPMLKVEDM